MSASTLAVRKLQSIPTAPSPPVRTLAPSSAASYIFWNPTILLSILLPLHRPKQHQDQQVTRACGWKLAMPLAHRKQQGSLLNSVLCRTRNGQDGCKKKLHDDSGEGTRTFYSILAHFEAFSHEKAVTKSLKRVAVGVLPMYKASRPVASYTYARSLPDLT